MHIMHSQEMSSSGFLGSNMVDIGSSDAEATFRGGSAAGAITAFFNGSEVFRVDGVAEVEDAARGDGVAEALLSQYIWRVRRVEAYSGSRWPYAVEHVCAECYGDHQILRVTLNQLANQIL